MAEAQHDEKRVKTDVESRREIENRAAEVLVVPCCVFNYLNEKTFMLMAQSCRVVCT